MQSCVSWTLKIDELMQLQPKKCESEQALSASLKRGVALVE